MAATAEDAAVEVLLAVDVGSSSVRCCPFAVSRSSQTSFPLGSVGVARERVVFGPMGTASAPDVTKAAARVVLECVERLRKVLPSFEVKALGFACFSMSLVGVDSSGNPVTPVFTYADRHPGTLTALATLKELSEAAGSQARIEARTGAPLHSSYAAPQLARLR